MVGKKKKGSNKRSTNGVDENAQSAAPPAQEPPALEGAKNGGGGSEDLSQPSVIGIFIAAAAAIFGLWVSFRVTMRHLDLKYGEALEDALCNVSETISCDNVLNSDYATVAGMPVSLPQLANFVLILVWVLLSLVGSRRLKQAASSYIFGMGLLSVAVSAFMFYISKSQIGSFCPYCMMLYGANTAVFIGGLWASGWAPGRALKRLSTSLAFVPLLLGSAALWGGTLAVSQAMYDQTKDRYIAETLERQAKDQEARKAELEAKGMKFPTVTDTDPWTGAENPKITVVEFADFECGYCKRLSYELKRVKEEYGDSVRFVFKNYPMNTVCNPHVRNNRHRYACGAAVAAECAHKQGRFWDYHDVLFKNNHRLRPDDLEHYAEEIGLDMAAFDACQKDPATMDLIREDMDDAKRLEVSGTPRTYIEGEELRGAQPAEILAAKLSKALGEATARVQRDRDALIQAREAAKTAPTTVAIKVGTQSFTIDAFEAAIEDGKATTAADREPAQHINWFRAKEACEAAGKRLCTQAEWMSACMDAEPVDDDSDGKLDDDYIEGREYPYGESYISGQCWVHGDLDNKNHNVVKSGYFAQCKTPSGVYDLTGNVAEWVGDSPQNAVLMGGGYSFQDKAKCFKTQDTYGPGWANRYTGFRCCQ